jgi:UDP-N-acetylmuramate dehydrogenase
MPPLLPPELAARACYAEPMAAHTTFKVGGPADVFIRAAPQADDFPELAGAVLRFCRSEGVPHFILGGGANLLVADQGIRGVTLDMTAWTGCAFQDSGSGQARCTVRSGTAIDDMVEAAAARGLGGLEFLAGMPGTAGGAVWMNARCYDHSLSGLCAEVEIIDEAGERLWVPFQAGDYGYKVSPFQCRDALILHIRFTLERREAALIRLEMDAHRRDREQKGHYRYPSAGSVFKNNRAFGKPSGKIIDELGLRGTRVGGAQIAPWHGNFIINSGGATAADIRALVALVQERAQTERGITLESEIIFV